MTSKELTFLCNNTLYKVVITYKKMRSIRYTYKDGVFKVSAPRFGVSDKRILDGLTKYAPKLIQADVRSYASGDNFMYLLGHRINLSEAGQISFVNADPIVYKNKSDLEKKLKKFYLDIVTRRTRYYEALMGIKKTYNVRVRKMTTRYGSNAYTTHSITYSMLLLHYSIDVIDSVVVHELAHDKVRNHSKKFYDVVYKYCPNYKKLHTRLRKGEFHD